MASIPAKVFERLKSNLSGLQKILEQAKNRDINEADTVVIVSDVLNNLFGYDKYEDITREYAIKGQYCDLVVKIDNTLKFLIEVKAIGITLQDKHYQQALDYGANNGTEWIVLTNGIIWKVYKVKFEKPIHTDFICEFNLLEMKIKNTNDVEKLFVLCKEGIRKNAIEEFSIHKMLVNKYYISAILSSESVIDSIRKELRKINPSIKPEDDEIISILKNDIQKREVIDSPEAIDAQEKYNKVIKKIDREKTKINGKNIKNNDDSIIVETITDDKNDLPSIPQETKIENKEDTSL
jgi:predicted type IV restriction endonuclease